MAARWWAMFRRVSVVLHTLTHSHTYTAWSNLSEYRRTAERHHDTRLLAPDLPRNQLKVIVELARQRQSVYSA